VDLGLIAARTPGFAGADLANLVNEAALGYTQQQPTEDRYLMTRAELLDRLDVLLGGRVAEQLALGDASTGAQDDLQRATDLVRHMITRYGMSVTLGLAVLEGPRPALFLPVPGVARGSTDRHGRDRERGRRVQQHAAPPGRGAAAARGPSGRRE
jgi:ATP-dependent Zn protease